MTPETIAALVLAVAAILYLLYALLNPEKL
ncbi:MAG TPA: potassium-transporting ATPase subunit F [Thermoanaerobaculia bacterium]